MDFNLAPEQQAFREKVTEFLERELTPDVIKERESKVEWGPKTREFIQKLGRRGWLTPTWPKEFGGIAGSNVQRLIISDELAYRRAPHAFIGAGMAGPVILLFGAEKQKKAHLPRIARGEIEFALGYTEPHAGSDLASLEMSAVDSGDSYVLNGQKIFNTACHYAQFHWLAARTGPPGSKHKGVSLFIVPLDLPGITIQAMQSMDGHRTNAVFYDNVRIGKDALVGKENHGFSQIATALAFERMTPTGELKSVFDALLCYAKKEECDGQKLIASPVLRRRLTHLAAEIEIGRLLSYKVALMLDQGTMPSYEASMLKLWASDLRQRLSEAAMQVLGPYRQLDKDSPRAVLDGRIQQSYYDGIRRKITGGTSEIQRNIIAMRGLGLPRSY